MILKKWRQIINPVDWTAWVYGKIFLGHPWRGFISTCILACILVCAIIIAPIWFRGVDKYKQENHKKKDNSSITSSVPQTPKLKECQIIVNKLETEYIEKHNTRPSVGWINRKLREEGYNFTVAINTNQSVKKSGTTGIYIEGSNDITLKNITTVGMSKGVVIKNTKNVKATNVKNIYP